MGTRKNKVGKILTDLTAAASENAAPILANAVTTGLSGVVLYGTVMAARRGIGHVIKRTRRLRTPGGTE